MRSKIANLPKLFAELQKEFPGEFLGMIDQVETNRQVGFATTEPDQGPNVKGKFVDVIEKKMLEHGIHGAMMPFPTCGKLVYVIAVM